MKLIALFFATILSFFVSVTPVSAEDLSVQCSETFCTLSSHDPLFPAGDAWTPEKSLTKTVEIDNTAGGTKDISLRIYGENKNKQLDEYIHFSITNENSDVLWSGNISEFIETETILLTNLAQNDEYVFSITASMDTDTPNELQTGQSSTFDIGFGFEGDQTESDGNDDTNEDNSNSEGDENSNNEQSSNQTLIDQILTGAQTFLPTQTGGLENTLVEANDVLAATDGAGQNDDTSRQAGEQDACVTNQYWPLALVFEIILLLLIRWATKGEIKVFMSLLTALASGVGIFLLVCLNILSFLALLPLLILLQKRNK